MVRKIAAMQPYLFPYLGYFQLINAVDEFVLGDVLQYEKESWINRNRILVNGQIKLITFPLKKDGLAAPIKNRVFADTFNKEMPRLLKTIRLSYSRAPNFPEFYPLLQKILLFPDNNLFNFTENSIREICRYVGISTPIRLASSLDFPFQMEKQERVVRTVKALAGDMYVNPIGGMALYDSGTFERHGLQLRFHRMNTLSYAQFNYIFHPNLSIIDVLMFNSPTTLRPMLTQFSLFTGERRQPAELLTGS